MKICDICGKEKESLNILNLEYRTDDIKDVCDECLRDTNDQLWKIREVTTNMNEHWIKRYMSNLRIRLSRTDKDLVKTGE